MTRNGKIARLPKAIRDQLNQSLEDGVPGISLVNWLNMLPEVRQVMTDHFEGRDINEVNLSEWKAGGFLDWQARRDMHAHAVELMEEGQDLKAGLPGLAEHLGMVVAGRYAELLNKWNGEVDEAFMKKLKGLRMLCQDVAVLRREDRQTERLALDREKWVEQKKDQQIEALECCLEEGDKYPEVKEAFQKAFVLLKEYGAGQRTNREHQQRLRAIEQAEQERIAAEKRRPFIEQAARIEARKARWQAAHPGQDPQAGKWWEWQPVQADQEEMTKEE